MHDLAPGHSVSPPPQRETPRRRSYISCVRARAAAGNAAENQVASVVAACEEARETPTRTPSGAFQYRAPSTAYSCTVLRAWHTLRHDDDEEGSERMGASGMLFGLFIGLFGSLDSNGQFSDSSSCTSLQEPVVRGLTETLEAQTAELAEQFNMSFTVGVAMCDGSEIATSAGLDDRFARTPLHS